MSSSSNVSFNCKCCRTGAIWLTIGVAISIAALTLMPINLPEGVPGNDKIYHILVFAALTIPCAALYPKALLRVMLAAALYGAVIEIIQPFVGRSGELGDLIGDLMGIGLGAALGLFFYLALPSVTRCAMPGTFWNGSG